MILVAPWTVDYYCFIEFPFVRANEFVGNAVQLIEKLGFE
jgi:hypothetical protein